MFSTADYVLEYVKGTPEALTAFSPQTPVVANALSGGLVNHVWKVDFSNGSSLVLKHFPPFIRTNPDVKFPQQRGYIEYLALEVVSAKSPPIGAWDVPKPIHFDKANHVLLMQYVAGAPMVDYLRKTPTRTVTDVTWIVNAVVEFLTTLHSMPVPDSRFETTDVEVFLRTFLDGGFRAEAEKWELPGVDEWRERTAKNIALDPKAKTLCFGDFWPNSVLVNEHEKKIYLIDWEMATQGQSGRDWTQIVANLFLMANSPSFDREATTLIMNGLWERMPRSQEDGFDYVAGVVLQVTTLVKYDHWGLNDDAKKDVVFRSTEYFK
ncbi:kinase-like domain-containing protein [Cladochytrium replicatum]|nr:kinase-like domain-containing protein [Cladochytrium replicatum]